MKFNKLISIGVGLMIAGSAVANTVSVTVLPGTMTNLLAFYSNMGSVLVKQIVVAATVATNASLLFIDTPTNSLVLSSTVAYTNILSYATNNINTWTNFYGVVSSTTNIALIDIKQSIPGYTNNYPQRLSLIVPASTTVAYQGVNYYFDQGIWVTNTSTSPGVAAVTITY